MTRELSSLIGTITCRCHVSETFYTVAQLQLHHGLVCFPFRRVVPAKLISYLNRCVSLRHVWLWYEGSSDSKQSKARAKDLREVQRAVPRVTWHLDSSPYECCSRW